MHNQPNGPYFHPFDGVCGVQDERVCTEFLQAAIDRCHQQGGGTVWVPAGTHRSGTLILRSRVRLHLDNGALIQAVDDLEAFPSYPSAYPAYNGEYETLKALVIAEDAESIAITGEGTLDGNGEALQVFPRMSPSFAGHPRILYFRACRGVQVRDITLRNGCSWIQTYQSCQNVQIRGITVDSNENPDIEAERYARTRGRNNDGIDIIDSQRVTVSDCRIVTGDDGICLKSLGPDEVCRDICITNCVISTNCSGIKIGSETAGAFSDITVSNCVIHDTRCDGIALSTVDGARVERVTISNIQMRNIKQAALFIRLGARHRSYRKDAAINTACLRDILIHHIQATRLSAVFPCSITGLPGRPVEGIRLDQIHLETEGGIPSAPTDRIEEHETAYPSGRMFGTLPCYGFYLRHIRDISLNGVTVRTRQPDGRPPVVADDVQGLHAAGCGKLFET